MLKKSSGPRLDDGECLLDVRCVDGEQAADGSYGSLQNAAYIPRRYFSASANNEVSEDDADEEEEEEEEEEPIRVPSDRKIPQQPPLSPGNYFKDGRTKIDFVLVWEVRHRKKRRSRRKADGEEPAPSQKTTSSQQRKELLAQWRERFVQNLQTAGLLLEKEETANEKKTINFLKLSAPWEVLVYHAEEMCIRAPLQVQPSPDFNTSARIMKRLCIPNVFTEYVPRRPLDYYTCNFRKSKMDRFLGCNNHETYFSSTQRHRIVYEILAKTAYGKRRRAEVGVARLLTEGAYSAAFPLHEGKYQLPTSEVSPDELNKRQVLFQYWARWSKWYKYQPLDHIREYFGEKIAIYFAWLGFYTAWLLPAALVGLLVFLSGVLSLASNEPAQEICTSGASYLMCPLCNTCKAWNMSDICPMAKVLKDPPIY